MIDKSEFKRRALMRVRKHKLKYISILPSFITLVNGMAGFGAICIASKGFVSGEAKFRLLDLEFTNFGLAGLLIFLAMIADMLDGRVARMSHSTSSFGGQLDSLCDVISFGIAPAFLVFKYLSFELPGYIGESHIFENFIHRFVWIACTIYISCAVIRLARFNVENEEDESSHMIFAGLPSPAAAGVLTCLVVFVQDLYILPGPESMLYKVVEGAIVYSLPVITICIGILMISRVKYPHLINQYLRGKKPLTHLIMSVVAILLIVWSLASTLVIAFCGFALFGFVRWLFMIRSAKHKIEAEA